MSLVGRIFFWIFTIGLGFVNPLISIGLIILYYLPGIIQDLCQGCKEDTKSSQINNYSDDILEAMK